VAKWLGLKWVIPMHYEKGSSEPDRFKKALKHLSPKTKILVLKPGEWQYFSRR
jgi:L-ascorbate metabolism protein UlaG (beta-lactamase superfamily)